MAFIAAPSCVPALRAPLASASAPRSSFLTPRAPPAPRHRRAKPTARSSMTPTSSVSLGVSDAHSTAHAVHAALQQALSGTPSPTLALVTHTVQRDAAEVHQLIRQRLPHVRIHGATTCGALLCNAGAMPNGLGIMLHDSQRMSTAACSLHNCDVVEATNRVVSQLKRRLRNVKRLILATSPGIEEQVLHTLSCILPHVEVFGGSAADNNVSGEWKLLADDGVFSEGLSAVGISDEVPFGSCLVPPYERGEQYATVTKCEGRVIHELDGRRAGDVLREWVGDSIETQAKQGGQVLVQCAAFPLGIERVSGAWIGIHAAQISADGSVALFAEAEAGDKLTVMRNMGGRDSATAASIGLERAYKEAMREGGLSEPKAAVVIYCGGLSIAVGDELNKSLEALKGKATVLGMTAFGEQGHVKGSNVHSNLAVGVALFG